MQLIAEKCVGCGECALICPQKAVRFVNRKAEFGEACSQCGACARVCPHQAVENLRTLPPGAIACDSCPVRCVIKDGFTGACQRFVNRGGALDRTVPLKTYEDAAAQVGPDWDPVIRRPLITGIGAGGAYPDCKPAPHIVQSKCDGVDIVTVVTEAPLSYSGIKLKIDTDMVIGEEGSPVFYRKKHVGHLCTEEYGSKIIALAGVNTLTGPTGFTAAQLTSDLANRKRATLRIGGGSKVEVQVGKPPVIDGVKETVMRVGCGSATLGLFSALFVNVADEVIVLDSHITGLMSEHAAGRYVGAKPSGISLVFPQSTPGRYFGDHGKGWGGTSITAPETVIHAVNMSIARPGMTVLITETTGRNYKLFSIEHDGRIAEIEPGNDIKRVIGELADTCEESRVSAIYCGGSGGSARAGVTKYPIKLTRAVHGMKARLTVGGAPVFLLPGGGINFMVDVEKVTPGAFTWVPTPATVCPIEYTMTYADYEEMGGHLEAIKPFRPGR